MKKIGKRSIWISIVVATMLLTGCGNQTGSADRATGSDAADFSGLTTEAIEVTTEEATTEAVIEAAVSGSEKPEAVPATTEIGGGKKKAEETTEEQKPNTTESTKPSTNHSNDGSASSGQSTTPKPSNNGSNSGNSGSNNGGSNNSTPSPKPSTPATTEAPKPSTTEAPKPSTTEAPTTQHQHVYDQVVVDTPEQRIDYPEQGYYAPAMQCHGCHEIFTSSEAYFSHPCGDDYGYSSTQVWIKTGDPYTKVIPAKTHRECKCGARE